MLKFLDQIICRELLVYEKQQGTQKDLDRFTETLNILRRRHLDIVPKMAQAVFKLNNVNSSEGVTDTVQYFLDRLYINRCRWCVVSVLIFNSQDLHPHAHIPLQCFTWPEENSDRNGRYN